MATSLKPTPATVPGPGATHGHQSFWLWVMCLTGVDYFSTLGYQPSIAFEATGLLTPFATVLLVVMTLFGAYPVYAYVSRKSPHGQGSIAMLERLVSGWGGKLLVLVLLGFAATDFVITKTLSAADAAEHLVKNPFWPDSIAGTKAQLVVTMVLLTFLGAMFLRGFSEVIGLAVVLVIIYLTLNLIVVGSSLLYLQQHGEALQRWQQQVQAGDWHFKNHFDFGTSPWGIFLVCFLYFPKLALGLSGFETGVAVMPLIKGDPDDTTANPQGRIRNVRKLLITAALIMSAFLLGSSLVTSTLIDPEQLRAPPKHLDGELEQPHKGGKAANRALAYLAHGEELSNGERGSAINPMFGEVFGTIYDLSTVAILWFAGASAMAGLLNLVPQYLPRYGMAPEWARAFRPLVIVFTLINLFVTWWFNADVEDQGGAYATGVLVLMSSACVATVIDRYRASQARFWFLRINWYFLIVMIIFLYTTVANILEKPDGIKIASFFILSIVFLSIVSRYYRSKELRFQGFEFANEQSQFLWDSMKMLEFPVLVPHRPGSRSLKSKEEIIRKEHRLGHDTPIVFIEASLGDTSNFYQTPVMEIVQDQGTFTIRVQKCVSIAPTIAALALELSKVGQPPEIHFGWSNENPMAANVDFLLFGEGNVPWLVRDMIEGAEPDPAKRPRVVIG